MFSTSYIPAANEYCFMWTGRDKDTHLIYLDDIVIWGVTLDEHNQRLIEVLDRLRVQSLKLEPDKCEFLRTEVYFLGYKITADGVVMDEKKVAAIKKLPTAD